MCMYEQLAKFIKEKIIISDEEIDSILPFFKTLSVKKNEFLVNFNKPLYKIIIYLCSSIYIFLVRTELIL